MPIMYSETRKSRQAPGCDNRLIVVDGVSTKALRASRNVGRSDGAWLTIRLPARTGMACYRGANPSGLPVAWLIRGASAIVPEISRARRVPTSPIN